MSGGAMTFTIVTLGLTLETLGEVLLGLGVYFVHKRVIKEHRIDNEVLKSMLHERTLSITAIILIVVGYFMQMGVLR
jgi:hypothetical protein